jgi:CheY-like chemotaxis protein
MRRILVVDDDLHVGQAIGVWLKHHGFRVSTADSGPGGLVALDQASFDLMIVDAFMPNMRGFEPIRLFHERAPSVPLIAISGYAFPESESAAAEFLRLAMRLGATRCLRKPFKPATLLAVIDECLAQAEPHRRQVAALGVLAGALSARPRLFRRREPGAPCRNFSHEREVVVLDPRSVLALTGRRPRAAQLE